MSIKVQVDDLGQQKTGTRKTQTGLKPVEVLKATDLVEKILSERNIENQFYHKHLNKEDFLEFVRSNTAGFPNNSTISEEEVKSDAEYQINFREQLQSPFVKSLPSQQKFEEFSQSIQNNPLEKKLLVELNGPGQIDPENQNYSQKLIRSIIQSGGIAGLHLGAKINFLEKALPTIMSFSEEEKKSIILKFFVRIEKYDPKEIIRILLVLKKNGFPEENIRVGIEHIFSLVYTGLNNLHSIEKISPFFKALSVYQDLLQILKNNNVSRISIPETRGIATKEETVRKTTYLLLNLAKKSGVNPSSCELHFHDDFETADRNTIIAAQTILSFNKQHQTRTTPIIDTTILGGERSGIAGEKTLSEVFGSKFFLQTRSLVCNLLNIDLDNAVFTPSSQLLRRHTAGTHIDLVWNKVTEILQKISEFETSGDITQLVYKMEAKEFKPAYSIINSLTSKESRLLKNSLSSPKTLVTIAFLLVYGESIRKKVSCRNKNLQCWVLEPIIEITTPVQGKKNLITRLLMDGYDVTDNSKENYIEIIRHLNVIIDHQGEIFDNFTDLKELLQKFALKYKETAESC